MWDINNSTGVFRYLPEGNFSGKHSFALSAISGTESVERFFNVLVQPQNDSPIFLNDLIPDVFTFREGIYDSFSIPIYDSDSENLTLTINSQSELPLGLELVENRIEGIPVAGEATSNLIVIELSVLDPNGASNQRTINLSIEENNDPPVVFDEQQVNSIEITLGEDFETSVWYEKVSKFAAVDPDGDEIYMQILGDPPDHGTLILEEIYSEPSDILFFADSDFVGLNSFKIKLHNGDLKDVFSTIDFRIRTTEVNDAPVIKSPLPLSSVHEAQLFSHQFIIHDPDLGDTLNFELQGLPPWINYDGNLSIYGSPTREDFINQHKADIKAVVRDKSGASFSQVFTFEIIPLNYSPDILYEGSSSVLLNEDTAELFEAILTVDDVDTQNTDLEWQISKLPDDGSLNYEFTDDNLTFWYRPNPDFFGFDAVTISIRDRYDQLSYDSLTFNFEVSNIPDAPKFLSSPYTGLLKGTPWQYDIIIHDPDDDNSLLVEPTELLPEWLTLRKKTTHNWVLSGMVPNDQESPLSITLRVIDSQGQFEEQSFELFFLDLSEVGQIEINEQEIGEQVIYEDNNWSGGSLSVNAFPGREITWTIIEKPQFGEFLYEERQNGTIQGITYAPQANFYGMDSLVIQASDGFSNDFYSFKFRVLSVVDKPEFIFFTDSLLIEDRDNLNLTISFSDGDGMENLSYSSEAIPSWITEDLSDLGSGKIYLTGNPGVNNVGDYSLKFSILGLDDGLVANEELNLSVQLLNYPPTVQPENISISMKEDTPSTWVVPH